MNGGGHGTDITCHTLYGLVFGLFYVSMAAGYLATMGKYLTAFLVTRMYLVRGLRVVFPKVLI